MLSLRLSTTDDLNRYVAQVTDVELYIKSIYQPSIYLLLSHLSAIWAAGGE
jgi:hypothetical protein